MNERFRPVGIEFAAQAPKDPKEQIQQPPKPVQQIMRRQMRRPSPSGK